MTLQGSLQLNYPAVLHSKPVNEIILRLLYNLS
jgi:hypothetical protein